MRKNFGPNPWLYPQPVLLIATYDEAGRPDVMNAAWGGPYSPDQVMLSLSEHQTTRNLRARGAFTVSFGDARHAAACDYVGLVSAADTPDKLEKAGFHTTKSEFVDAPIIDELPLTLECRLVKFNEDGKVIGQIANVSADEGILDGEGNIDTAQLNAIVFDPIQAAYRAVGDKVAPAFQIGASLK